MDDQDSISSNGVRSPMLSPQQSGSTLGHGLGDDSPELPRALRAAPSFSSLASFSELSSPGRPMSDIELSPIPGEEPRKARHRSNNLAAFGAKLSSSTGVLGNGLKSKMFRQSKTDLKALRKKADLTLPINDRSPMARTSRELDRIAALGTSPAGPTTPNDPVPRKHHILMRKKDSPAAVLSSSSSNSKLASEGSVYSFHGPSPTFGGESPSFKTRDECVAFMSSTWSLLCSRTQTVFSEAVLRIPVEDANTLVTVHFAAHVQSGANALEMVERLNELLKTGLRPSVSLTKVSEADLLKRLAESWTTFFTKSLLLLEAIFLPLQLEVEGQGNVFKNSEDAGQYWGSLKRNRTTLSVRHYILTAYRNIAILPIVDRLHEVLMQTVSFDESGSSISDRAARVTQCLNTLALLQTGDSSQARIDELVRILRESWVSRPRLAKDRRGLVLKRPERTKVE